MRYNHSLLVFALIFLFSCKTETVEIHPFEAYLAEVDPVFEYELSNTIDGDGYTAFVIRMVSQEWLTEDIVNETKWWHWLTVVVPNEVDHEAGFLWIGGGTNYTEMPESVNPMLLHAALTTNSITADLHNVPFQPIAFLNDDRLEQRYEDDLIAYGWRKFMEGGAEDDDAEWLARFPMTTAAVRAMDTITDFIYKEYAHVVDSFVVGGASKRGWTTWTTAIFDDRVIALTPVVIDLLNVIPSFQHHWQSLGEWSPAIREYENERIMDWMYSAEFARMLELVDPYSYLDRLTMPKFIVNAASDEFFLPDSWQFYWGDLQGDNYLRYVPNSGHSTSDTDIGYSIAAFHYSILNRVEMPQFQWSTTENGFEIQLDPENLPDQLLLWNAHNPEARDFRLYVIDRIWISQDLEIPENGRVTIDLDIPDSGFSAWFAEATFNASSPNPFKQTTGVLITPDEYPFEAFSPEDPLGTTMED